jgi:hypothetical protein
MHITEYRYYKDQTVGRDKVNLRNLFFTYYDISFAALLMYQGY